MTTPLRGEADDRESMLSPYSCCGVFPVAPIDVVRDVGASPHVPCGPVFRVVRSHLLPTAPWDTSECPWTPVHGFENLGFPFLQVVPRRCH